MRIVYYIDLWPDSSSHCCQPGHSPIVFFDGGNLFKFRYGCWVLILVLIKIFSISCFFPALPGQRGVLDLGLVLDLGCGAGLSLVLCLSNLGWGALDLRS